MRTKHTRKKKVLSCQCVNAQFKSHNLLLTSEMEEEEQEEKSKYVIRERRRTKDWQRVVGQRRQVNTFQEGMKIKLPPFTSTRWYYKILPCTKHT